MSQASVPLPVAITWYPHSRKMVSSQARLVRLSAAIKIFSPAIHMSFFNELWINCTCGGGTGRSEKGEVKSEDCGVRKKEHVFSFFFVSLFSHRSSFSFFSLLTSPSP